MKLTVIGCGRLGAPYAAAMADLGHDVLGVETNPDVLEVLRSGFAPFDEPGLGESIARNRAAGRLRFTDSYAEAAQHAELHFLAVATPTQKGGLAADLGDLGAAFTQLATHLQRDSVILGKSTVPVGTTALMRDLVLAHAPTSIDVEVGWSPDFLRESTSLQDVSHPDRIVLGVPGPDSRTERLAREAWAPLLDAGVALVVSNCPTIELSKHAANAFLATKTSFINAMAEVCEASGADVADLTRSLGLDPRIGSWGLTAGLGYGGSCLAKDLRAFIARAEELGIGQVAGIFREVDLMNVSRRTRYTELARQATGGTLDGVPIALWGASFKPGVDDIRDSPALDVAVQLHAAGAQVRLYDPAAASLARAEQPDIPQARDAATALAGAQLLMVLTDWPEFTAADPAALATLPARARVIDARNCLDPQRWTSAGWTYTALGRPTAGLPATTLASASSR